MDAILLINSLCKDNPKAQKILLNHSKKVQKKALKIAKNLPHLKPDLEFIKNASLLHDIGIIETNAPEIQCFGKEPYIKHGIIGRKILEELGYKKLALVCERHIGVGLSKEEIIKQKLPLPKRDMLPKSIEEKIICLADKFFSKKPSKKEELSIQDIKNEISKYGKTNLKRLNEMIKTFLPHENE